MDTLVARLQRVVHRPDLLDRRARPVEVLADRQAEQDRRHRESRQAEQPHPLVGEHCRIGEGPEHQIVRSRPREPLSPHTSLTGTPSSSPIAKQSSPTLIALKATPAAKAAAKPAATDELPRSASKTYADVAAESAKSARSKTAR